jgi:DNA-binding NarL/FixJ family response regulator
MQATGSRPPTIVMADDHAIVRAGFRALIEQAARYQIVAECSDADGARAAVAQHRPDLLVLDISLPGGGLNFLPEVRASHPDCRVLILSMHDNPPFVSRALQLGALGYVSKGAASEELISALAAIQQGQAYISADLRTRQRPGQAQGLALLSEREREVFLQLARGATPKQTALELGISVKTVYLHRASIREKLAVRSDLQLHQLALERGVV